MGALFWIILANTGLVVEPGTPDALCPTAAQVRDAVEARVGRIELPEAEHFTVRYTIVHRPDRGGDFVLLELIDPGGERRLERELPMSGETCATLAQSVALVVDRYFRDLALGSPPPEPQAPPAEADSVAAEPKLPRSSPPRESSTEHAPPSTQALPSRDAPAERATPPPTSPEPAASDGWDMHLGLLAGGAWSPESVAVGGEFAAANSIGRLSFDAVWLPRELQERIGTAEATLQTVQLRASAAVRAEFRAVTPFAGVEVLASAERAEIADERTHSGVFGFAPGVGVHAGTDFRLFSWGGVGLRASLDWVPSSWMPEYVLEVRRGADSVEQRVLRGGTVRGFVGGVVFFDVKN